MSHDPAKTEPDQLLARWQAGQEQHDPETIKSIENMLSGFASMSERGHIDGAALMDFSAGTTDLPTTANRLGLFGSRGMALVFELLERAGLAQPPVPWGETRGWNAAKHR